MPYNTKSIRPFIGAQNFEQSRLFYARLGFTETVLSPVLSVFKMHNIAFYLQNAYVQDWVDNTMIFEEVEDVDGFCQHLQTLQLPESFPGARITPPQTLHWGKECFVHDPSGILWHFGQFN